MSSSNNTTHNSNSNTSTLQGQQSSSFSTDGLFCSGRVSFTDFAAIAYQSKFPITTIGNDKIRLVVENELGPGGQMPKTESYFARRHDFNPTLKPYGQNHRLEKLIALVSRKKRTIVKDATIHDKNGKVAGNDPNNAVMSKKLFASRQEISALCRHLEKLKKVDPLYSVAIYKLKAMMARDEAMRELKNLHLKTGPSGREFSFINPEQQTYFTGSPINTQANQTNVSGAQGQNSYSIIEIELEEQTTIGNGSTNNNRNPRQNMGKRKLPFIDSIEQKLQQKQTLKSTDATNDVTSQSRSNETTGHSRSNDVPGHSRSKITSDVEGQRGTKNSQSNIPKSQNFEFSSPCSPQKSAHQHVTSVSKSADTLTAAKPVCIKDFYLFSKSKASKPKMSKNRESMRSPKQSKTSKQVPNKQKSEDLTRRESEASADFSNIHIADLFSNYKPEQKFSKFDSLDENSMQNMVTMENVTDFLISCNKDAKSGQGSRKKSAVHTDGADSQPKQNIPVEVYNKPSSSSAHSARAETADIRAAAAADTKSKQEDSESQDLHCDSVRIKNAVYDGPEYRTLTCSKSRSMVPFNLCNPIYLNCTSTHNLENGNVNKTEGQTVNRRETMTSLDHKEEISLAKGIKVRSKNFIATKDGEIVSPSSHRLSILFHRKQRQNSEKLEGQATVKRSNSLESSMDSVLERGETAAEKYERKNVKYIDISPNSLPQISEREKSTNKWRPRQSLDGKSKDKSFGSNKLAGDLYPDPICGAPPLYLHRIHELIDSVNESVRVERQKPNKRTKTNNQHRISLTNSVLNKDKQT